MFNNLKTAYRYLTRDRVFSYINILGLAVGLTAVLCITVYVMRELNYDRFHRHGDRTYRVSIRKTSDGIGGEQYTFTPPIGADMKAKIPEIEEYVRRSTSEGRDFIATYNEKLFKLTNVCYADTAFFDIFSFPLVRGNRKTALTVPFSIVLTEESASKFFGDEDPIGQIIRLNIHDYTVTGIVKSPPVNSHFQFNALLSFSTLYRLPNVTLDWDGGYQYITYVRLHKNADLETVKAKMQDVIWEGIGKDYKEHGINVSGNLHPLYDLHLYHDHTSETLRTGIIIFSVLALIILAIACINFVNLTIARSMRRVREASMRKVMGAKRFGLMKQFLGESLLISIAAFILSLVLFQLIKPLFIQLAGELPDINLEVMAAVVVFVFALITGVIGGSYPAMRLSSLNLAMAPKGGEAPKSKRRLQNILIVIQFASAIFLIVCTMVASKQLTYMRNINLGFNKDGILVLPFNSETAANRATVLKQLLKTLPEALSVSASSEIPDEGFGMNGYYPEGMEKPVTINVVDVDEHFLEVYGVKLQAGRFFSGGEQDKLFYVVNESLAKDFGWNNDAIGKTIARNGNRHEIIGIVENFNYEPLYSKINPLIITNDPEAEYDYFHYLSIKYHTAEVSVLVSKVEKIWNEVNPDVPFEYYFFDELYENQYRTEMSFRSLFAAFSGVAIILAVLGVLGLMAYTTEQRKKEIGIRKVCGASVIEIIRMLNMNFIRCIALAFVVAVPVAWYVMHRWLEQFAYKTSLDWWLFVLAGLMVLLVSVASVSLQSWRAARINPVKAIRKE